MSDTAKKSQPAASAVGSKVSKAAEGASDVRSAPRSAAAPSLDKQSKVDEHVDDAKSGNYTHEVENGLKEVEPEPETNGFEHSESQVESQAGHAEDQAEDAAEEGQENAEETASEIQKKADEADVPDTQSKASLTRRAKQAFDLAAEGESTSEARNAFHERAGVEGAGEGEAEGEDKTVAPHDSVTQQAPEDAEEVQQQTEEQPNVEDVAQSKVEEQAPTEAQQGVETEAQEGTQVEAPEGTEGLPEGAEADIPYSEVPDMSVLKDGTINKLGYVLNPDGLLVGRVTEGDLKELMGKRTDGEGRAWNDKGEEIGRCEPISEKERDEILHEPSPFEDFQPNKIDSDGMVVFEGEFVGKVIEGEISQLRGKSCDADGEVLDKSGQTIGRCERWEPEGEPEPEEEAPVDRSALDGGVVNKKGYVEVDGKIVGQVIEGTLAQLVGKRTDAEGIIWSDSGKQLGRAELLSNDDRDDLNKASGPFGSFPNAIVGAEGWILNGEGGEKIGKLVEGDPKALHGQQVDADGDITDQGGRSIGKAERWEEPEAEAEEAVDRSLLDGGVVNKRGYVELDGRLVGKVSEGDLNQLIGKSCDAEGIIYSGGKAIGRAELLSNDERNELNKATGPFGQFPDAVCAADGWVLSGPGGEKVGRVTSGDLKAVQNMSVEGDGEILDRAGRKIGTAERWEAEPEPEKEKGPMAGLKVNREGDVRNSEGDVIGKLTSGDLSICAGKEIDNDGDVLDGKGTVVGHVSLLQDIPKEEESADAKAEREQTEQDKKIASQMAVCIEQCLEKVQPVMKQIKEKMDQAEAKRGKDEEVDEDALVRDVRPLIEQGGNILSEAHGIIKGLDPDGRISAQAKHKTATRDATPEEYRLADLLKELTVNVQQTIDDSKKRLENFPKAKKELSPLWRLCEEPLGQIIAAVGLLLNGVIGLLNRLLGGLGLGNLLGGLLGSLGIQNILDTLGVPKLGGGKKEKGGGGGLLGGLLGGGK